ncbi:hypothetical protein R5H30_01770 [Sulfitobacter sp. D35]|uniref:hypothetical protein n=1 Tax=Sulfitobacter sp. D35 TaxID=3083252 RepID=UPI00296FD80D|nr:hypothetical protein [Sulfitobacter sp. D35]MDW4496693.1 hypothetical protein [Sulfitobacter sp. D35]
MTVVVCSLFLGFGFALGLGATSAIGMLSEEDASAGSDADAGLSLSEAAPRVSGGGQTPRSAALPRQDAPAVIADAPVEPDVAEVSRNATSDLTAIDIVIARPPPRAADNDTATGAAQEDTGEPSAAPDGQDDADPVLSADYEAAGGDVDAVALHLYAPRSVPKARMMANVETLERTGFPVASPQRVNVRISEPHLRFYDSRDAGLARSIGAEMGIETRDFSASGNGRQGLIEVWLDGKNQPRRNRAVKSRNTVGSARAEFMTDLRDLRRHLAENLGRAP